MPRSSSRVPPAGIRACEAMFSSSVQAEHSALRPGQLYKLPMLGKLFSFSGKSSLYRTGSARCSTTLRGIVPKTEANLLMHSDLCGLGRRRAVEKMRGAGEREKRENVQEAEG